MIFVTFIFYFKGCRKLLKDIGNPIAILESYNSENINNNFEKLNNELLSDPTFGNLWYEYEKTLIKTKNDEGIDEVYSTIDSGYFINDNNIIEPRMNMQFYNSVPGSLTGLGILGTFLGLTIGLGQIDLGSNDVQVLKDGIKGLLSGVATAFSTSLWGIFFSLIFTFLLKYQIKKIQSKIGKLNDSFEHLFIRKTPENILVEMLNQSRQQTLELKNFNDELALSIAEALDERLASRLTPTFDKLLLAIEELSDAGTSKIAESISKSAGQEIAQLSEILSQVKDTFESTANNSQDMQQRINESFSKHITVMADTINDLLNNVAKNQQLMNDTTQEKVNQIISKIEESITHQNEWLRETTSQAGEMFAKQIGNISSELSGMLSKFEEQTSLNIGEMHNQTKAMSDSVKTVIGEVTEQYNNERTQMIDLLQRFENTLQQTDTIIKQAGQVAASFENAAQPVMDSTNELRKTLSDLQVYMKGFSDTVIKSQDQMSEYSENNQRTLDIIQAALDKTQSAWQAYENKFNVIRDDLEAVFDEIANGLREYRQETGEGIQNYLNLLDEYLNRATGTLAGVIEELSGTVTDLESTVAKLRNGKSLN
jgi:methyl-accepting chemotaxis protein